MSETKRNTSEPMEALLGQTIPVLDKGFVKLVDYMGDEAAIVQAARVSYGAGTKTISEDRGLIRYLIRHRHTSPLEMCEIKLHVKVPMDCWRQWIRTRTANVNEYSTRYSLAIEDKSTTKPEEWRLQAKDNKQGSCGSVNDEDGFYLSIREEDFHDFAKEIYEERLKFGVAREQARKDLPLSTYTEAYWKIDLHNLLHFLKLRMDEHAQLEIRSYATAIGERIVKQWMPNVWDAFMDYQVNTFTFTKSELDAIISRDLAKNFLDYHEELEYTGSAGEKKEFVKKLSMYFGKNSK